MLMMKHDFEEMTSWLILQALYFLSPLVERKIRRRGERKKEKREGGGRKERKKEKEERKGRKEGGKGARKQTNPVYKNKPYDHHQQFATLPPKTCRLKILFYCL